jgi:uncharacterized protein YndB with AHSA1/START domain
MPSIPTTAIRVARRFPASPARVFDAWLDRRLACRWLFATAWRPAARMDVDARVGGRLRIVERRFDNSRIEHRGEILQFARPRRIAFSLTVEGHAALVSRVVVDVEENAAGCALALTHDGVPRILRAATRMRWIGMLYGLGTLLAEREPRIDDKRSALLRRVA